MLFFHNKHAFTYPGYLQYEVISPAMQRPTHRLAHSHVSK